MLIPKSGGFAYGGEVDHHTDSSAAQCPRICFIGHNLMMFVYKHVADTGFVYGQIQRLDENSRTLSTAATGSTKFNVGSRDYNDPWLATLYRDHRTDMGTSSEQPGSAVHGVMVAVDDPDATNDGFANLPMVRYGGTYPKVRIM